MLNDKKLSRFLRLIFTLDISHPIMSAARRFFLLAEKIRLTPATVVGVVAVAFLWRWRWSHAAKFYSAVAFSYYFFAARRRCWYGGGIILLKIKKRENQLDSLSCCFYFIILCRVNQLYHYYRVFRNFFSLYLSK